MNLLYIDYTEDAVSNSVVEALKRFDIEKIDVLSISDYSDENFLAELINMCKVTKYDFLLTMEFVPSVSLACGVLGVKYVSWISKKFSETNYDFAVRNEWNYIFTSNMTLCELYAKSGVKNAFYVPPIYNISLESVDFESFKEPDIYIWTEGVLRGQTIGKMLPELRDSSKGYVDALIECIKLDYSTFSMFDGLADYVRDDFLKKYPVNPPGIMTAGLCYDTYMLYEHIDTSLAYFVISQFVHEESLHKHLKLVCDRDYGNPSVGLEIIGKDDAYRRIKDKADGSSINIVIPPLRFGRAFPQDAVNLIACGGKVFMPEFVEVDENHSEIEQFRFSEDAESLVKAFIENRAKLSDELRAQHEKVLSDDSLCARLEYILEKVQELA